MESASGCCGRQTRCTGIRRRIQGKSPTGVNGSGFPISDYVARETGDAGVERTRAHDRGVRRERGAQLAKVVCFYAFLLCVLSALRGAFCPDGLSTTTSCGFGKLILYENGGLRPVRRVPISERMSGTKPFWGGCSG